MSSLEDRVARLESHFDISDPESFLSKFNKLFNDFQDITDKWQVNMKLTVGEIDPKVVIEDGKVDGRDLSEDGKVLGINTTKLEEHATLLAGHKSQIRTINDQLATHKSQIRTINDQLTVHLSDQSNPHGVTAKQAKALSITGGKVTGNVEVKGNVYVIRGAGIEGQTGNINGVRISAMVGFFGHLND